MRRGTSIYMQKSFPKTRERGGMKRIRPKISRYGVWSASKRRIIIGKAKHGHV